MFKPIIDPELPYVGEVDGGIFPGKMLKVQGKVPSDAVRFAINYQLGPNLNPRDDIAIHVSPRFPEGIITRNHIQSMNWGPDESSGPLWIKPGENFEIIILCEQSAFKIAVNGRHFADFEHRLPYQRITNLVIDGDVDISSIFFETIPVGPPRSPGGVSAPDVPTADFGPPPPGGLYPSLKPQGPSPGGYGPPPGGYGPPPGAYNPGDRNPSPKPYRYQQEEEEEEGGISTMDKVGLALGGLVAAGGVAAAMHAINKKLEKDRERAEHSDHEKSDASRTESEGGGLGSFGSLGAALASSLASNALRGNNRAEHAQQGYPQEGSGMLGSILGALGGGGNQQPSYSQPQSGDPLGGLGSILGGVLGGGGGSHQPQYQPSGGYGGSQSGGSGDFLSSIGGALFSSAMDGLSKHKSKEDSHRDDYHPPPPPTNYGRPQESHHEPSRPAYRPATPPSPPPPGGGKLSASEISKGLGLGDDDDD